MILKSLVCCIPIIRAKSSIGFQRPRSLVAICPKGRPLRLWDFLLAGRTGRERLSLAAGRSIAGAFGWTTEGAVAGATGKGVGGGAGVVGVTSGNVETVLGVPGNRESTELGVCGVSGAVVGMDKGASVVCGTPIKAG